MSTEFEIVVVGGPSVGKTTLIENIVDGTYPKMAYDPTVDPSPTHPTFDNIFVKEIKIDEKSFKINIMDTEGYSDPWSGFDTWFSDAQRQRTLAYIIVTDRRKVSLDRAKQIMDNFSKYAVSQPVFRVFNDITQYGSEPSSNDGLLPQPIGMTPTELSSTFGDFKTLNTRSKRQVDKFFENVVRQLAPAPQVDTVHVRTLKKKKSFSDSVSRAFVKAKASIQTLSRKASSSKSLRERSVSTSSAAPPLPILDALPVNTGNRLVQPLGPTLVVSEADTSEAAIKSLGGSEVTTTRTRDKTRRELLDCSWSEVLSIKLQIFSRSEMDRSNAKSIERAAEFAKSLIGFPTLIAARKNRFNDYLQDAERSQYRQLINVLASARTEQKLKEAESNEASPPQINIVPPADIQNGLHTSLQDIVSCMTFEAGLCRDGIVQCVICWAKEAYGLNALDWLADPRTGFDSDFQSFDDLEDLVEKHVPIDKAGKLTLRSVSPEKLMPLPQGSEAGYARQMLHPLQVLIMTAWRRDIVPFPLSDI